MTQNEVSIIKNAVLDATEAYVDARLDTLAFVKTLIGVVQGNPIKGTDKKYRHTVKCNATSATSGIIYDNVLSVGNVPFPKNSVVFLVAPNAQYSNQFILGKLDDTPCNISAGSITLGDAIYLSSTADSSGSYGHISNFKIYADRLEFKGANDGITYMKGTGFRVSDFVNGHKVSMIVDGLTERIALNSDGGTGHFIVSNQSGWDSYGNFPNPEEGNNYFKMTPTSLEVKDTGNTYTCGAPCFKFLSQSQVRGDIGNLAIYLSEDVVYFLNVASQKRYSLVLV